MPDNPQRPSSAVAGPLPPVSGQPFALPDYRILSLSGRDALAFAQAQFMNDIDALADGQWHWNGWLTPKGRIIALFALLRIDAQHLWLLLADADPEAVAGALRRFVFRSKITMEVLDEKPVSGSFSAPEAARGNAFATLDNGALELDLGTASEPRRMRLGDAADEAPARAARWRRDDLRHGLPHLLGEQVEHWTPQQLSLERLRAFSVKKGCYPGQEIVARTHFLGKVKRGLVAIEADAPLASGQELQSGDRVIGPLVSTADDCACWSALAVVPLADERPALRVGATPVREAALLDGLAR